MLQTWDGEIGRALAEIAGDRYSINQAAFSPNGATRVITVGEDEYVHIWDSETGRKIVGVPFGLDYDVSRQVLFSGDGRRLAVIDRYYTRIWDITTAVQSGKALAWELCANSLPGVSVLTRDEMRLVGYAEATSQIDVCSGMLH
jgi:WD40 repeat protein